MSTIRCSSEPAGLANRIGEAFEAWDKYVEKMPSLKDKDIKFIFDEWGNRLRSASTNRSGGFMRPSGMLMPLSYALCLHEMFRHSDMIAASCATGGLRMLTDNTGEAVGFAAEGVVMKLMQTHFLNALPIAVDGDSPQQLVPGTPFVDRGNEAHRKPNLSAGCSRGIFKRSQEVPHLGGQPHGRSRTALRRQISGVKLRGQGKLYQIAPPSVNSQTKRARSRRSKLLKPRRTEFRRQSRFLP